MCSGLTEGANKNVEFFGDGSLQLGAILTSYGWVDDSHLRIDSGPGIFGCVAEVRFEDGKVILTGIDNGEDTVLVRKPEELAKSGSSGRRDDILGAWAWESGWMCSGLAMGTNKNVEFFTDGSLQLGAILTSYGWVDDSHLRIEPGPGIFGCVAEVRFEDGKVILTGIDNGEDTVLVRK